MSTEQLPKFVIEDLTTFPWRLCKPHSLKRMHKTIYVQRERERERERERRN